MWRMIVFLVAVLMTVMAYVGWQRYSFLMEPLPKTDTSGLSIEDESLEIEQQSIDIDFLESEEISPSAEIDLSFVEHTENNEIDISFLLGDSEEDTSGDSRDLSVESVSPSPRSRVVVENVVADFLDVDTSRLSAFKQVHDHPICIFDPVGQGGDIYEMVQSFQKLALDWGVKLTIKTYNSEAVVVDSFKAGRCAAIAVTGTKVRPFNRFAATIEAVGGMPDHRDIAVVLEYLTQPDIAPYLREGDYEVAGVFPVGNVYSFVRHWSTVGLDSAFQGRKVGVYDSDGVSLEMIRQLGATPVLVDSSSFAGKFNNGAVDMVFAPAVAYEPMELYRGLGQSGKIVDYPLIQLTYQIVIRHKLFPDGFGELLREVAYKGRGFAMEYVHLTEKRIPNEQWYLPSAQESVGLQKTLLAAQEKLQKAGIYDGFMLQLMRKARCQREPTHYECAGM